ncbi:MAG: hypothetical protein WAM97_14350 [Acidimicrobiales bacterium]
MDLWLRARHSGNTVQFDEVQQSLLRFAEGASEYDGQVLVAAGTTKANLDRCEQLMRSRVSRTEQRFYFQNPLQFDAIVADDEPILSCPRKDTDRDFALHFRNPAIVRELWDILEAQQLNRDDVDAMAVRSKADVEEIRQRICDLEPISFAPMQWD